MDMQTNPFSQAMIELIQQRRSFGGHPLWFRIQTGEIDREKLKIFAGQFFLQVREFPRAISAIHANCPYPDERAELAENVYEEDTGRISGCNCSHPELFIRFAESVGLSRDEVVNGQPLPGTAALINWFELVSKQRSYLEATAAMTMAAEGQVPGAFAKLARGLQSHYGLTTEQVEFWDLHEMADADHSDVGDHAVIRHADTPALQNAVQAAVEQSLSRWWDFFDGIERAIDAT
ncbi:MAG: iron-containing redox enzyme family protein [Gammaproteobacteria bacterium]|nr:iron-containing redox enzyme family protein [Gammaproteobacteria bacterium]